MTIARSFVIATIVLILAQPASAAAWTTVVQDLADGGRVAGLIGESAPQSETGVSLVCDADSELPPLLEVVFPPAGPELGRVDELGVIGIGRERITAAITRNDSSQTSASSEIYDAAPILSAIADADGDLRVTLELGGEEVAMSIPVSGVTESLELLRQGCPRLSDPYLTQ